MMMQHSTQFQQLNSFALPYPSILRRHLMNDEYEEKGIAPLIVPDSYQ